VSVLLLATLAVSWLAVSAVFVAACCVAGRADRLARSPGRPSGRVHSDRLRLIERDILRG
jgi:hypothetical protein